MSGKNVRARRLLFNRILFLDWVLKLSGRIRSFKERKNEIRIVPFKWFWCQRLQHPKAGWNRCQGFKFFFSLVFSFFYFLQGQVAISQTLFYTILVAALSSLSSPCSTSQLCLPSYKKLCSITLGSYDKNSLNMFLALRLLGRILNKSISVEKYSET